MTGIATAGRFCLVYNSTQTATGGPGAVTGISGEAKAAGIRMEMGRFNKCQLLLDVTAASGTNPTLDVWVQKEVLTFNGTAVWTDIGHFTQAVAVSQRVIELTFDRAVATPAEHAIQAKAIAANTWNNGPWGDEWRAMWTIGGVGPSFTFTVTVAAWN